MSQSLHKNFASGAHIIVGKPKKTDQLLNRILASLGIKKTNNPDLLFINSPTIGIDQIREAKKFLSLKNWQGKFRVIVITAAENMTVEAQNSFLKTLEELRPNHLIFLTAPNQNTLLPTITSRCQIVTLSPKKQIFKTGTFEKLLRSDIKARFKFIQENVSQKKMTKEAIIEWIDNLVLEAHDLLNEAPRPASRDVVSSPLSARAEISPKQKNAFIRGPKNVPWFSAKEDKSPKEMVATKNAIIKLHEAKKMILANVMPLSALDWFIINL